MSGYRRTINRIDLPCQKVVDKIKLVLCSYGDTSPGKELW